MKTMKKLLSVLLLVCMLASMMTVAAFADGESDPNATDDASSNALLGDSAANGVSPYVKSVKVQASSSNGISTVSAKSVSLTVAVGDTITITPSTELSADGASRTVQWAVDSTAIQFQSSDGDTGANTYKAVTSGGNAVVTVYTDNGEGGARVSATCTINISASVQPTTPTTVTITSPSSDTSVCVNESLEFVAEVTGNSSFRTWVIEGPTNCATFNSYTNQYATLTAGSTSYSNPITVYAVAKDGTESNKVQVWINPARTLQLTTDITNVENVGITSGESVSVWVVGAETESFNWSYTTTPSTSGVISSPKKTSGHVGTGLTLTAGSGDGYVTVTATSRTNSKLSASITIPVNTVGYGDASIAPVNVTWTRGQGNLTFTVEPQLYAAYMDGVCFTGSGNTSKYSYVWSSRNLVINSSYLSTLSAGEHILKVDTVYTNGEKAGIVYAYITINGTASAAYGDNAHVRGNSNNLYFNSNNAISSVYISNQLIDPSNYTLSNNNKSITLKADFLNLLNYGTYTMKLVNSNGTSETATFRIVTASYAPATGDDSNLAIWVAVMMISGIGAIALIPRRKKEM